VEPDSESSLPDGLPADSRSAQQVNSHRKSGKKKFGYIADGESEVESPDDCCESPTRASTHRMLPEQGNPRLNRIIGIPVGIAIVVAAAFAILDKVENTRERIFGAERIPNHFIGYIEENAASRACYERMLSQDPDLEVQMFVLVTVARDGSVVYVNEFGDLTEHREMAECVLEEYRRIRFPSSRKRASYGYLQVDFTPDVYRVRTMLDDWTNRAGPPGCSVGVPGSWWVGLRN